ncbi:MAG: hypothetical protein RBG1_1C00001G1800 [candidate division Zixibacteria bacterium RBG-1]|nr:MAG: hypothetical protein RBG1_1C00001G1800 [candidate division Zixibacteria bacterium RBG-1]OGC86683.1 MAG: hypothetical protein A2V73_04810 [candidate division Zixibacteria bacterium RBG_19FT_COMBO_42_43]
MKSYSIIKLLTFVGIFVIILLLEPSSALAHCDAMDGPVVKAAQRALETGNVNLVLIWVRKEDTDEIKKVFQKTLDQRKKGSKVQESADHNFFETLVRIHRAGEGALFTGLKPAGQDFGPAIPAVDKAVEEGKLEPVLKLITETVKKRIEEKFQEAMAKKNYKTDDVEAGREYIQSYVEFMHYVDGIYQQVAQPAHASEKEFETEHKH